MKDYKQVVEERYQKEEVKDKRLSKGEQRMNAYAVSTIKKAVNTILKECNASNDSDFSVLDVGCGDGTILQFVTQSGIEEPALFGVDLTPNRIARAKKKLPNATFSCEDALSFDLKQKFSLVMAFDLFSHFTEKKDILKCLEQCKKHLKPNGIFVWYDIHSKDHFNPPKNIDSWGFSDEQFQYFLSQSGFEIVSKKSYFKNYFFKIHTLYQVRRLPLPLIKLSEKLLPGPAGNKMYLTKIK